MPLFKKSISEKLNLDLINFADKEKENLAKKTLYLRKDVEKDQKSLMAVGLATGLSTTLVVGSFLSHVTNTIPLDVAQSMAQMAIVTSAAAFAATPLMNLYDKMKDGLCKISGDKLKSVNEYEYDYQDLSIFKERIAGKLETPISQSNSNQHMTAEDVKLEGRDYLYNSFATGVVGTMLAAGLTNGMTNILPVESVETIMKAGLYALPLYAVSPVLSLIDKCKENYNKVTASLKTNAALANEIDNGLTNTVFVAPVMEAKQVSFNANMPKIENELPARKPEVPMNQEGLMDKSDYVQLVSDIRTAYAAKFPDPTVKPVGLHDNEYFIADIENEINLSIDNANIQVSTPTVNVINVPYVKDDLKKPLFIDAFTKPENNELNTSDLFKFVSKINETAVVGNDELSTSDFLRFASKTNEVYQPLPEVEQKRQLPKEIFIFEEPELKDITASDTSLNISSMTELNINIPKELEGLKASKNDDVLPILEVVDKGFKVKEGDHVKAFFKNQILKQKGIDNPKPENLVANKQDRIKPRMTV